MPDVPHAVRTVCLWLPEAEEVLAHGSPNFRVRGKTFACFVINHHGDGRVALWLLAAPGAQEQWVSADPESFFVPPYVGTRGWLGVELNRTRSWKRIAMLVREAYAQAAPASLCAMIGEAPRVPRPTALSPSEIDPLRSARGRAVLEVVRGCCLRLPETREASQFGSPVWQAGKKTFASARWAAQRFTLSFWVGIDQQALYATDPRFHIPAYLGHNGWIAVDVTQECDAREIAALAIHSYRHFALRRMLLELGLE